MRTFSQAQLGDLLGLRAPGVTSLLLEEDSRADDLEAAGSLSELACKR